MWSDAILTAEFPFSENSIFCFNNNRYFEKQPLNLIPLQKTKEKRDNLRILCDLDKGKKLFIFQSIR